MPRAKTTSNTMQAEVAAEGVTMRSLGAKKVIFLSIPADWDLSPVKRTVQGNGAAPAPDVNGEAASARLEYLQGMLVNAGKAMKQTLTDQGIDPESYVVYILPAGVRVDVV